MNEQKFQWELRRRLEYLAGNTANFQKAAPTPPPWFSEADNKLVEYRRNLSANARPFQPKSVYHPPGSDYSGQPGPSRSRQLAVRSGWRADWPASEFRGGVKHFKESRIHNGVPGRVNSYSKQGSDRNSKPPAVSAKRASSGGPMGARAIAHPGFDRGSARSASKRPLGAKSNRGLRPTPGKQSGSGHAASAGRSSNQLEHVAPGRGGSSRGTSSRFGLIKSTDWKTGFLPASHSNHSMYLKATTHGSEHNSDPEKVVHPVRAPRLSVGPGGYPTGSESVMNVNQPAEALNAEQRWKVPTSGVHYESLGFILGSVAYAVTPFWMNPGLQIIWQWLYSLADPAEMYRIVHFFMDYVSSSGFISSTVALGSVCTWLDCDFLDSFPISFQACEVMDGAIRGAPTQGFRIAFSPKDRENPVSTYYVRPGAVPTGRDPAFCDPFIAYIATIGQANGTAAIGEVMFGAAFDFMHATSIQTPMQPGGGFSGHWSMGTNTTNSVAGSPGYGFPTYVQASAGTFFPTLANLYTTAQSIAPHPGSVALTPTASGAFVAPTGQPTVGMASNTMTLYNYPIGANFLVSVAGIASTYTPTGAAITLTSGANALNIYESSGAMDGQSSIGNTTATTTIFNKAFTITANPVVLTFPSLTTVSGTVSTDVFLQSLPQALTLSTPGARFKSLGRDQYLAVGPVQFNTKLTNWDRHLMLPCDRVLLDNDKDWRDDNKIDPTTGGVWIPSVFPDEYKEYLIKITNKQIDTELSFDQFMTERYTVPSEKKLSIVIEECDVRDEESPCLVPNPTPCGDAACDGRDDEKVPHYPIVPHVALKISEKEFQRLLSKESRR